MRGDLQAVAASESEAVAAIYTLLTSATLTLSPVTDAPRDEAEWLLAELLDVERSRLRQRPPSLTDDQRQQYAQWVARRAAGEPFAYVTGTQPFRRLMLRVTPDVLIPRADTEHLVAWALERLSPLPAGARVLDACTGSGCVALALADELPGLSVWASDLSEPALTVARGNALRLGLNVQLLHANGLHLPGSAPRFDLITANPPYIAEGDPHLPALAQEPRMALVAADEGMALLQSLIDEAPNRLKPGGWLLLEHGYNQAAAVRAALTAAGFTQVATRRDYGGNDRVSGGQWPAVKVQRDD